MSVTAINKTDRYKTSFQSLINNSSKQNKVTPQQKLQLTEDTFDDGKISVKNGFKHFLKGIISPIQTLLSSPKNLLIGTSAILATVALCAAFPPLLPVMVALGVTTGTFQILKGGYEAISAKTDKDTEMAWENIGSGTFTLGTSILGAKNSLKAAGINKTENLNIFQSVLKCFKEIPNSITKSYKMAKNGTACLNLKNTISKPQNYSDIKDLAKLKRAGYSKEKLEEIKNYSELLHKEGSASVSPASKKEKGCIQELINIFPEELRSKINYRVKCSSSIKDKLINKLIDKEKPVEINSLDEARKLVGDLIGANLILDDVSESQMNLIVDALAKGVKNDEIKILEIHNYKGKHTKSYFTSDHVDKLNEVAKSQNIDLIAYEGFKSWQTPQNVRPSGYTTAQMNIQFKDGSLGEFQIRGKDINNLANIEHIPYDLRQNKDLSGGNSLLRKLYKPLEKNIRLLSNKGYDQYNDYLNALYSYYRKSETGIKDLKKPQIRDFIKSVPSEVINSKKPLNDIELQNTYNDMLKMLDIENIELLYKDASWLKKIPNTAKRKVLAQTMTNYLAAEQINNQNEVI